MAQSTPTSTHRNTARKLNQDYLALHVAKEDLFWTTYMGIEKKPEAFDQAESALKEFISAPERLKGARAALASCPESATPAEREALEGWVSFFEANAIENEEARVMQQTLIEMESALFRKRAQLKFQFKDQAGKTHEGSTNVLSVNVSTSPDEVIRKTSHDALLQLEQWVMANGFLDLVRERNRFARMLGFPNFFAYKLMKNEKLNESQLDAIFLPFEKSTREKCFSEFERIVREKGSEALKPHQMLYSVMGDVQAELNPHFPFSQSIARWGLSFSRLGIRYRQASLTLDLLDRAGKYENGFMHGPQPCYFDEGKWVPARINFTSNATPSQVGSGLTGLLTLFHEGGHAAHFSNILQSAPCFSQEFPPTSMAFAETQSMFCDSLISDADWRKLYAKDRDGAVIPDELLRKGITQGQPLRAYRERSILVVANFEQRLYRCSDSELTLEQVTRLARDCEREVFNLPEGIARPLMAIPHLLSNDGACSYQGYLLANMAVYQTRSHFLKKYGYLTNNEKIGEELAESYWSPGNRISHGESVQRLTGQFLNGDALAVSCNASPGEVWENAQRSIHEALKRPLVGTLDTVDLDAHIRVVHGSELICENTQSFAQMSRDFEKWIEARY
ncbi:MAG: peptidase M3 [Methylotenera sp.]|nr:peptidase M3 [Oligoflexia bacterium]